ncbi:putative hemerythrin [Blattamonas nauphoetae]|uniref:Hemerythrin n=1 Tax=Blattamonas nauphoetae TaxID=2049346 RepID=A0ABQ9Y160_9EUKA|nr:putative hemerythrin [Blattamonas nauphoetae]
MQVPLITYSGMGITCFFSSSKTLPSFCTDATRVFGILFPILYFVLIFLFYTVAHFFVYDSELSSKAPLARRSGSLTMTAFVLLSVAYFVNSFLIYINPTASCIIVTVIHLLIALLFLTMQPFYSLIGNQIITATFAAAFGGGVSACLLPIFAKIPAANGVVGGLVSWIFIIGLPLLLAFGSVFAVKGIYSSKWIIKPLKGSDVASTDNVPNEFLPPLFSNQLVDEEEKKRYLNDVIGFTLKVDKKDVSYLFSYNPEKPPDADDIHHISANIVKQNGVSLPLMPLYHIQDKSVQKILAKQFTSVRACDGQLRFLQNYKLSHEKVIVELVDQLFKIILKKQQFSTSPKLRVLYALFLSSFRPNSFAIASQLQQVCQLYPNWSTRWVTFLKTKESEGRRRNEEENDRGSVSYQVMLQLSTAEKYTDVARAHLEQMWLLLQRRNIDVNKIQNQAEHIALNKKKAETIFISLLDSNPNNYQAMRKYGTLLRDIECEDGYASILFHQADILEEASANTQAMQMEKKTEVDELEEITSGLLGAETVGTLPSAFGISTGTQSLASLDKADASRIDEARKQKGDEKSVLMVLDKVKEKKGEKVLPFIGISIVVVLLVMTLTFLGSFIGLVVIYGSFANNGVSLVTLCDIICSATLSLSQCADLQFTVIFPTPQGDYVPPNFTELVDKIYTRCTTINMMQKSLWEITSSLSFWKNNNLILLSPDMTSAFPTHLITRVSQTPTSFLKLIGTTNDAISDYVEGLQQGGFLWTSTLELVAFLVYNVPLSLCEGVKRAMLEIVDSLVKSQITLLIILVILMVLIVVIVVVVLVIPIFRAILRNNTHRRNEMRKLCMLPSETIQKQLERLDPSYSDQNTVNSTTHSTSQLAPLEREDNGFGATRQPTIAEGVEMHEMDDDAKHEETPFIASAQTAVLSHHQESDHEMTEPLLLENNQPGSPVVAELSHASEDQPDSSAPKKKKKKKKKKQVGEDADNDQDGEPKQEHEQEPEQVLLILNDEEGEDHADENTPFNMQNTPPLIEFDDDVDSVKAPAPPIQEVPPTGSASLQPPMTEQQMMFMRMMQMQQQTQNMDPLQAQQFQMMQQQMMHNRSTPNLQFNNYASTQSLLAAMQLNPSQVPSPTMIPSQSMPHAQFVQPPTHTQSMTQYGGMTGSPTNGMLPAFTPLQSGRSPIRSPLQTHPSLSHFTPQYLAGATSSTPTPPSEPQDASKVQLSILEQMKKEEDEEKQNALMQKEEDVEEKLRSLKQATRKRTLAQLAIGTLLVFALTALFFVFGIISLLQVTSSAEKLLMNGYRRNVLTQIRLTLAVYVSGLCLSAAPDAEYDLSSKYTTEVFTTNSQYNTYPGQAKFIEKLVSLFSVLNSILQLGSVDSPITGDSDLDSIIISRTQNSNDEIDDLLSGNTSCLMKITHVCTPGRIPGLEDEFYGLNALLIQFTTRVTSIISVQFHGALAHETDFIFAWKAAELDLDEGIQEYSNIISNELSTRITTFQAIQLIVFILTIIGTLVVSLLLFLPIPSAIRDTTFVTQTISNLSEVKEMEAVKWSDELVTQAGRIDYAHQVLIDSLAVTARMHANKDARKKIQNRVDNLVMYTATHFSDEEAMMKKYQYPHQTQKEHLKAHVRLFRSLVDFANTVPDVSKMTQSEVVTFCSQWITRHIKTMDKDLGSFLLSKASAQILSQTPNLDITIVPPSFELFLNSESCSMAEKNQWERTLERILAPKDS